MTSRAIGRRVLNSLSARFETFSAAARNRWHAAGIDTSMAACRLYGDRPRHSLPAPLVVSLTTHRARFPLVHRTLACLLMQTVKADAIVLWVAEESVGDLPAETQSLAELGIEIRGTRDVGPFTKLVPALTAFPDSYIVTADDDAYYDPEWLQSIVGTHDPEEEAILCRRAHRVRMSPDGSMAPYRQWEWDVQDPAARRSSTDLFPTGVGGVLYPPGSLGTQVCDISGFRALSPGNDDVWFYWMARMTGTAARKVGPRFAGISWPGSQASALARTNVGTQNDQYLRAMTAHFGLPQASAS